MVNSINSGTVAAVYSMHHPVTAAPMSPPAKAIPEKQDSIHLSAAALREANRMADRDADNR